MRSFRVLAKKRQGREFPVENPWEKIIARSPSPRRRFKRSNTSAPRDEIYAPIIYRVPFRPGK